MRFFACAALAAGLLLEPSSAGAQGIANTFTELRLLVRPGDKVTIEDGSGNRATGAIESLSATELVMRGSGRGTRQWLEADVARIRERRGDSLGNGALIGLATGAGVGMIAVGISAARSHSGDSEAGWVVVAGLFYGGIGAGIGAGVDALITRERVIFERPGGSTVTMRWAPLLARRGGGAALTLTF